MNTPYQGQLSRRELLHHVMVLEGHVGSLVETPMLSEDRLRLLRDRGAVEPMQGNDMHEMSDDALIRSLQAVSDDAEENADKWVARAVNKIGCRLMQLDVAEMVGNFCCFLKAHDLMDSLRDLAPKRVLTLCVWHAYLESF